MNRSKKLLGLIKENVFTGTGIGPSLPVKIQDAAGSSKAPRLDAATKKKANEFLTDVCKNYYPKIPLQNIFETLKNKFGIVVLQEDGTEFEGFLAGRQGSMTLDLGDANAPSAGELKSYPIFKNSRLSFSWYQMPETGNYELNIYLS